MLAAIILAVALNNGPPPPTAAPPVEQKQDAFTPEERKQALEALQTIAKTFGAPQAQQAPAQPQPQGKTMAEVADKALDMSAKYIGQAANIIEKAAPRVWAVMVKQQYAKAIGEIIAPIMWIVMVIILTSAVRLFWKVSNDHKSEDFTDNDTRTWRNVATLVFPGFICLVAGGVLASRLSDSAMYLINPEFYAIKDLVQILLRPGSM
jgi:hypothetical protein